MNSAAGRRTRPGLLAFAVFWLTLTAPAASAQPVNWDEQAPLSGTVEGGTVLVETSTGGVFPLVTFDEPEVGAPGYWIEGTVRYEGVEGDGYLEMWSHFGDGGRYFSRTLATTGEMAALSGDSDERAFVLPFSLRDQDPRPVRLEVNVVLPGAGRVWVGPVELQGAEADVATTTTTTAPSAPAAERPGTTVASTLPPGTTAPPTTVVGAEAAPSDETDQVEGWWSPTVGWLLGGLLVAAALAGAALGAGHGRSWPWRLVAAGVGLVVIGVVAVWVDQRWWVWAPLFVGGLANVGVGLMVRRLVRHQIDEEQRRMEAIDALR